MLAWGSGFLALPAGGAGTCVPRGDGSTGRQAALAPGSLCRLACLCPQQGEQQAPARRVQPHERCTEAPAPVSSPPPRPPTSPPCSPASVPSAWSTWAAWPVALLVGVRQPVRSWAREQMLPERAAGCWGSPLEPRAPCIPGVVGVDPWLGRSVQWAHCPCQRPRARAPGGLAWPPVKRTRAQHRLGCSPCPRARAVPTCACSEAASLTFQCGGLLLQGAWPGSCKPGAGPSASERWPDCGATWELAGLRDPGETATASTAGSGDAGGSLQAPCGAAAAVSVGTLGDKGRVGPMGCGAPALHSCSTPFLAALDGGHRCVRLRVYLPTSISCLLSE